VDAGLEDIFEVGVQSSPLALVFQTREKRGKNKQLWLSSFLEGN